LGLGLGLGIVKLFVGTAARLGASSRRRQSQPPPAHILGKRLAALGGWAPASWREGAPQTQPLPRALEPAASNEPRASPIPPRLSTHPGSLPGGATTAAVQQIFQPFGQVRALTLTPTPTPALTLTLTLTPTVTFDQIHEIHLMAPSAKTGDRCAFVRCKCLRPFTLTLTLTCTLTLFLTLTLTLTLALILTLALPLALALALALTLTLTPTLTTDPNPNPYSNPYPNPYPNPTLTLAPAPTLALPLSPAF
jgi:hypothetical protein